MNIYDHYCPAHLIPLDKIEKNEMGWACGAYGWCIGSLWGNRREGDHWGDLGVDGWIILGWISRRWDVGI